MARSRVLSRSYRVWCAALAVAASMVLSACQVPTPSLPPVTSSSGGLPSPAPVSVTTTATASPTPSVSAPSLSAEFVDRLDGSTATIPLGQAALRALRGTDEGMAFNKTPAAYDNLIAGTKDLILVTYPSQEEFAAAAAAGIEMEVVPVVKDALVFLANTANPVTGLTRQQIQDIYTGKVTDWGQVGGSPGTIIPYQRPVGAGSQTLFLKLAMDTVTPMDAPTKLRPAEMFGLVDAIAAPENGPNALGYSVFYYATQMYLKDTAKLIAVDGVMPSAQTVSDGTYPYGTFYYAVFRKDTPADSPVRAFVDWLLGDDAQKLAARAAYVPMDARNIVDSEPVYYLGATPENTTVSSGTGGTQIHPLMAMAANLYSCDDHNSTAAPVWTATGHPEVSQVVTRWLAARYSPDFPTTCYSVTAYQDLISVTAMVGAKSPAGWVTTTGADGAVFDVVTGRQVSLSDLFFDGVNYIGFLNHNLLNPWTNEIVQNQMGDGVYDFDAAVGVALPFTGIPRDYSAFELVPWGAQVVLTIDFPGGNPFVKGLSGSEYFWPAAQVPLPLTLSPYGAAWRLDYQIPAGTPVDPAAVSWGVPVISTGFPAPRASDEAVNAAIRAAQPAQAGGEDHALYGTRLSVVFGKPSSAPLPGVYDGVASLVTIDLVTGELAPFSEAEIPPNWWTTPNVSVNSAGQWIDKYVPPAGATYQYVYRGFGYVAFEVVEPSGRVLQVSVPA